MLLESELTKEELSSANLNNEFSAQSQGCRNKNYSSHFSNTKSSKFNTERGEKTMNTFYNSQGPQGFSKQDWSSWELEHNYEIAK